MSDDKPDDIVIELRNLDADAKARELGYKMISIAIPEAPDGTVWAYATRHKSRGGGTFQVRSETIAGALAGLMFPGLVRRLGRRNKT